jgi:hypothetical protein
MEIVYGLQLLQNNTTSETFLYKSEAVRSVAWIFIVGTSAWPLLGENNAMDKCFTVSFSNSKHQQPNLLPNFLSYCIPRGGLIRVKSNV